MKTDPPRLILHANSWTLLHEAEPITEAGLRKQVELIKEAGCFDSYCVTPSAPGLRERLDEAGLRFGGAFDANAKDQFEEKIAQCLTIGDGPINCQLADHDTPVEKAIELTIALMEAGEKLGARVHLEVHRDTCTETPEKTAAIIAGYKEQTGRIPLVNFDYSHPAVVKHLMPEDYAERLFDDLETFQHSNLWHMRPFNGQHLQIPITNGKGAYSPEYEAVRPFIRQALQHWLDGPRPTNELWVVPEQGCTAGYDLSCFPNIWQDAVVLAKDIRAIWNELTK